MAGLKSFLITGARAPAALHLARLMHGAGHRVIMADSLRRCISEVSIACDHFVHLPAPNDDPAAFEAGVQEVARKHQVHMILPTCEEIFHLAGIDLPQFAPPPDLLFRSHNKFEFKGLLQELNLAAPESHLLTSVDDLSDFRKSSQAYVFKPIWSRFGNSVKIKPKALNITPTPEQPWIAQRFIQGDEICIYAFAHQGRVGGLSAYRPVYRAGPGAGIAFDPVRDPSIDAFVQRFVGETGWTGQVAFDVIREASGQLMPIECNPRATSGIHFFRDPAGFSAAFLGEGQVMPDVTRLQAVKAALALYGPFQRPLRVWSDLWRAQEVLDWPGDPAPARGQLAATVEIAGLALKHRVGLAAASTRDIEWNGPYSSNR